MRSEFERLCASRLDLRLVTEETTPNRRTAVPRLEWSYLPASLYAIVTDHNPWLHASAQDSCSRA